MSEDAIVADVSVVLFVGNLEIHEPLIFGDVPIEFALRRVGAAAAIIASKRTVRAVMFQGAMGVNFGRI